MSCRVYVLPVEFFNPKKMEALCCVYEGKDVFLWLHDSTVLIGSCKNVSWLQGGIVLVYSLLKYTTYDQQNYQFEGALFYGSYFFSYLHIHIAYVSFHKDKLSELWSCCCC